MKQEKPKIVEKKRGKEIEQASSKEFNNLNENRDSFEISIQ